MNEIDEKEFKIPSVFTVIYLILIVVMGLSSYASYHYGKQTLCEEHNGTLLNTGACANLIKLDCIIQGNGCVPRNTLTYVFSNNTIPGSRT